MAATAKTVLLPFVFALCPVELAAGEKFCNGYVDEPAVIGTWDSANQFLPNGCKHRVQNATSIQDCMRGSWLVLMGGSNLIQINIQLLQMLGIDTTDELVFQLKDGAYIVADIIVKDGVLSRMKTLGWDWKGDSDVKPHMNEVKALLDEAPAPGEGIRITVFRASFWEQVDKVLDLFECRPGAWQDAPLSFITEIGAWYAYCSEWKAGWCPYKDYVEMSKASARAAFTKDFRRNALRLANLCAPDYRGGSHGCALMNGHYMGDSADYIAYNTLMKEVMDEVKSKHLRYIDLHTFTEQGNDMHMQRGHQDPVSATWLWNIFFSGTCASSAPAHGSAVSFDGPLCSAEKFQCEEDAAAACPDLKALCPGFVERCEGWCPTEICQLSLPCRVEVTCSSDVGDCDPGAELSQIPQAEKKGFTGLGHMCAASTADLKDNFTSINGSFDKSCRRNDINDNPSAGDGTYLLHNPETLGVATVTLDMCKQLCISDPRCVAIEFSFERQRCENWRVTPKATNPREGYACMRYNGNEEVKMTGEETMNQETTIQETMNQAISCTAVPIFGLLSLLTSSL